MLTEREARDAEGSIYHAHQPLASQPISPFQRAPKLKHPKYLRPMCRVGAVGRAFAFLLATSHVQDAHSSSADYVVPVGRSSGWKRGKQSIGGGRRA
eukprot:scaffold1590_cov239-Pinguiococcus_pyrenoidosus.AAC.20